jgi:putative hydroxymethylpyrimidine transporter CytX
MATTIGSIGERLERVLERDAPPRGILPVPPERRRLGGVDLAVLWGDLSVGLLVIVTGALLVPAMGLPSALLAILVGSAIGCVPLALVAAAGQREGVTGMVLFRPVLGRRGSFLPSALNLLQLVGWTAVEFWAMAAVANVVSIRLFSLDAYHLWLVAVAGVCTAFAIGGPILVVRRWLERFGIWVLVATSAWITTGVLAAGDLDEMWRAPGRGGLPFWLAVDLVVVMPVSWLPLVADYTRFARSRSGAAIGTYAGYLVGNVWFYALGALLVLGLGVAPDVRGIGAAIATVAGGSLVLIALLVGESDNAFANIYSSAVSVQNVAPEARQRRLIVAVGVVAFALALVLSIERYEVFLFLIGSVFVPLFGVFAADYFVLRRGRFGERSMLEQGVVRWRAFVPWVAGFVLYQWCVTPGTMPARWTDAVSTAFRGRLHLPFPLFDGRFGASLPSFRGGVRVVAGRVEAGRHSTYRRGTGGGAAISRMTAGSSDALRIVSSDPFGTSAEPHCSRRARPRST